MEKMQFYTSFPEEFSGDFSLEKFSGKAKIPNNRR
jgi:hypothetical protein